MSYIKSEINNIKSELTTLETNINKSIKNIESVLFKMFVEDKQRTKENNNKC